MKAARQLRPHYGHAVSGESFWPRSFSVNLAVETLRDGGSLALFGPRPTGKSSIMKEAARILREGKDHHPIEIDLEGRSGPAAFASKLIEEIPKPLRGKIVTGWTKLGGLPPALPKLLEGFGQKSPSPLPSDSKDRSNINRIAIRRRASVWLRLAGFRRSANRCSPVA